MSTKYYLVPRDNYYKSKNTFGQTYPECGESTSIFYKEVISLKSTTDMRGVFSNIVGR